MAPDSMELTNEDGGMQEEKRLSDIPTNVDVESQGESQSGSLYK